MHCLEASGKAAKYSDDILLYNENEFIRSGKLQHVRGWHTMEVINNRIFIVGGCFQVNTAITYKLYRINNVNSPFLKPF